jgi:GNAT superfamily N-acetyltransferase
MAGQPSAIRPCTGEDVPAIDAIINEAAIAYRGIIPADCWHEPYMSRPALCAEIAAGVRFRGWDEGGALVGIIGQQKVCDATLIRHAYVRPGHQGRGIGGALLRSLAAETPSPLLVGTWASASWAIRFYEAHGFRVVPDEDRVRLLRTYWNIPTRQQQTSVVLTRSGVT